MVYLKSINKIIIFIKIKVPHRFYLSGSFGFTQRICWKIFNSNNTRRICKCDNNSSQNRVQMCMRI